MAKIITADKIPEHFEAFVQENYGSNTAAGKHFTVSHQFIRAVISGRSAPTQPMLAAMGLVKKKLVVYAHTRIQQ